MHRPQGHRPCPPKLTCVKGHACRRSPLPATLPPPPPWRSVPGGSAANVLKGLAAVSGGAVSTQFMGMVGADEAGATYTRQMREHGVEPVLLVSGAGGLSGGL